MLPPRQTMENHLIGTLYKEMYHIKKQTMTRLDAVETSDKKQIQFFFKQQNSNYYNTAKPRNQTTTNIYTTTDEKIN